MHNLRIEGRKIFLDGFEVEGVTGYELKENVGEVAELTLRLKLQDPMVKPIPAAYVSGGLVHTEVLATIGKDNPERIVPIDELECIREIMRGELDIINPVHVVGNVGIASDLFKKSIDRMSRRKSNLLFDR